MQPPKTQLQTMLYHLAEEAKPAQQIDLWPSIQVTLRESSRFSQHQETFMNARTTKMRILRAAVLTLITVFLAGGLILVTPQGQAWAQSLIHFFTRSESDTLPVQPWQLTPLPTPGTPTPDPSSILDVHQSVAEVEQLAGYPVVKPGWLPDSLSLVGASYQPDQRIVRIFYRTVDTNGMVLKQAPIQNNTDCDLCNKVGASASVETVQIGSAAGEYVEGVWKLTDQGPVWEPDPYQKTLRWQANQMAFELVYMGQPETVTKADLVAIAESVK
jgi:hypothetical protein